MFSTIFSERDQLRWKLVNLQAKWEVNRVQRFRTSQRCREPTAADISLMSEKLDPGRPSKGMDSSYKHVVADYPKVITVKLKEKHLGKEKKNKAGLRTVV